MTCSCFQCCFSNSVGRGEGDDLSIEDVHDMLCNNQLGIDTLWTFEAILFGTWLFFGMVSGFALYNGATGTANPVTHFGWWALIEFAVICLGARVSSFRLSLPTKGNKLVYPVKRAVTYATVYLVCLAIGMLSNIVHFALTIVETSYCTSTFCTDQYGFLIVFIVILALLVFPIQSWIMFRVIVYQQHLEFAVGRSRELFDVTPTRKNVKTQEAAPAASGIDAPLLELVGKKGR